MKLTYSILLAVKTAVVLAGPASPSKVQSIVSTASVAIYSSATSLALSRPLGDALVVNDHELSLSSVIDDPSVISFQISEIDNVGAIVYAAEKEVQNGIDESAVQRTIVSKLVKEIGNCQIELARPFTNDANNVLPFPLNSIQTCSPPSYRYQVTSWDTSKVNFNLTIAHVVELNNSSKFVKSSKANYACDNLKGCMLQTFVCPQDLSNGCRRNDGQNTYQAAAPPDWEASSVTEL